jgi:1-acyl-sn-glycerol-3-phosphate acyltransferase
VVARLAVGFFFRSVEIEGFDRLPRHRPVLLVANHFNGLVDPVLLVAALRRLPRFMAKATLWKVVPARPLLAFAGIVPVARATDGSTAANTTSFARVTHVLGDGGMVAIFPEGTTHDAPRLAPVRTGAARIAAMAWADGGDDLVILPVGLTYEDKVALRSRALIQAGPPLDREVLGRPVHVEDHEAVNELTARIGDALAELSPDFDSLMQAGALGQAAEISLRDTAGRTAGRVPMADRERLARELADRPAADQADLIDRTARYHLALALARVSDRAVSPVPTARALVRRVVKEVVIAVVLFPFALAGVMINLIPAVIVSLAGQSIAVPVTKGTVRVLTALVVFPLTWWAIAAFDVGAGWISAVLTAVTFPLSPVVDVLVEARSGFWGSLLVFVSAPLLGLAAVHLLERWRDLVDAWLDWRTVVDRRGQLADVMALRAEVVAAVEDPLA